MAGFLVPNPVNLFAAPSAAHVSASSVLTRLRLETRGEHEAVERVLNLMDTALTVGAYHQRLEQFYGFYAPLEAALQSRCAEQLPMLLPRLNKTTLLRQDLKRLGLKVEHLPPAGDALLQWWRV